DVPRADQQAFKTVQIDVDKNRRPRPFRSDQTGEVRDLRVRTVTSTLEKRVAHDLRPVVDRPDRQSLGSLGEDLPLPESQITAEQATSYRLGVKLRSAKYAKIALSRAALVSAPVLQE